MPAVDTPQKKPAPVTPDDGDNAKVRTWLMLTNNDPAYLVASAQKTTTTETTKNIRIHFLTLSRHGSMRDTQMIQCMTNPTATLATKKTTKHRQTKFCIPHEIPDGTYYSSTRYSSTTDGSPDEAPCFCVRLLHNFSMCSTPPLARVSSNLQHPTKRFYNNCAFNIMHSSKPHL